MHMHTKDKRTQTRTFGARVWFSGFWFWDLFWVVERLGCM